MAGRPERDGLAVRERWGGSKAESTLTAVTRKGKGRHHVVTKITIIIIFAIIIVVVDG